MTLRPTRSPTSRALPLATSILSALVLLSACSDNPQLVETDPSASEGVPGGQAPPPGGRPPPPIDVVPGKPAPEDGRDDEQERLPPPAERATVYLGTIGGSPVTLVVDAQGDAIGLAAGANGPARLLSGAVDGTRFEVYAHGAGPVPFAPAPWPFGSAALAVPVALSVDEGASIEGTLDGETVSLVAADSELAAPSGARLDGVWQLAQPFCDSDARDCSSIEALLTLGAGTIAGTTGILTAAGEDLYPSTLQGTLTRLGDASAAEFVWNTYGYTGTLHLLAGETDRLLLLGTTASELADHPSLAWLLTRVP